MQKKWLEDYGVNPENYFIAILNGAKCNTVQQFLIQVGKAFKFPDYYGKNLDAFWDCINDLEWIEKSNYALFIINSDRFLKSEDQKTKDKIKSLINDVIHDWQNVPNHPGEEAFRQRADFKVIYSFHD